MSCRFPGANDYGSFQRMLARAECSVTEAPAERWDWRRFRDADGQPYARWGGFLDRIDRFDAAFFRISPREAQAMDPQQRMLLDLAWACLEDAAYAPSSLDGARVGVFLGACNYDYKELQDRRVAEPEGHFLTGTANTMLPNRLSYTFNFHGPSVVVDTACSSALVALHQAIAALRAGECELALAGGINLLCAPRRFRPLWQLGMLAPDGRCKTFDASADGYVRGEGGGLLLLRPLSAAVAAGDPVHAVLRGSAVNHGGRARTLTAPSTFSQAAVISAALRDAAVDPSTIDYVEAHGTGTPLGDPIEVAALTRAFQSTARELGVTLPARFCGLGSIKSNIGHLEGAAGIAAIMKVILALRSGVVPPTLHVREVNPRIRFGDGPFVLAREPRPWAANGHPRRAGVSSFGFGGVNAHVIVEEHAGDMAATEGAALVPLSARSESALVELARRLAESLRGRGDAGVPDVAATLQQRAAMEYAVAIEAGSRDELVAALDDLAGGRPSSRVRRGVTEIPRAVGRRLALPSHPFEGERYWLPDLIDRGDGGDSVGAGAHELRPDDPLVADHVVSGRRIAAGALLLQLVRETSGRQRFEEVVWHAPLEVERAQRVQVSIDGDRFTAATTTLHASGRLAKATRDTRSAPVAMPVTDGATAFYETLRGLGLQYGPAYRRIAAIGSSGSTASAVLERGDGSAATTLDAAMQTVAALLGTTTARSVLPAGIGVLEWLDGPETARTVVARRVGGDDTMPRFDVDVLDANGGLCLVVRDLVVRLGEQEAPRMFLPAFEPLPHLPSEAAPPHAGDVLLIGSRTCLPLMDAIAGEQYCRGVLMRFLDDDVSLEDVDVIDVVFFCVSSETLDDRAARAVLRWLQALDARLDGAAVKLVTSGAFHRDGDTVSPAAAAVHGLVLSFGQERPAVHVSCWDLPAAGARPRDVHMLHALLGRDVRSGTVAAFHDGGWRRRVLLPVTSTAAELPLRDEGVVMIAGGASGIGLETAVLLASRKRVRIAAIGEKPLDEERRRGLQRIAEAGGSWEYFQADLADRSAMERVVAATRERFGAIHGVVFAAIRLQDRPFAELDDAAFGIASRPKVAGTLVLAELLRGEPLELVLFHSSCIAWRGNAGQANYAAASAWIGAFAARLRDELSARVKVIEWGLWGEVGIVAGEVHRRRLRRAGILPISREDGVAALELALRSGVDECTIVCAEDAALAEMAALHGRVPAVAHAPLAAPLLPSLAGALEDIAVSCYDAQVFARDSAGFRELEKLACALLLAACERGANLLSQRAPLTLDDLVQRFRAQPRHARLVGTLASLLVEHGLAVWQDEGRMATKAVRQSIAHLAARIESTKSRFPELASHVDVLVACTEALPAILRGTVAATDVLFGAALRDDVARIYRGTPAMKQYHALAASVVERIAAERKRAVRILEIGAGTGATTEETLRRLARSGAPFEYWFTDVSASFLTAAEGRFEGARFARLDIERSPAEQGFEPASYDIVVAANVIHATADVGATLQRIKWLLAANGALVLAEMPRPAAFTSLVFGLLDGWWCFADGGRRLPGAPLLDRGRWLRVLREEGFRNAVALSAPDDAPPHLRLDVYVAESDGIAAMRTQAEQPSAAPAAQAQEPEPARIESVELRERVEDAIAEQLARAAMMPLAGVRREQPFSDHGVDSLVGTDIVRGLGSAFGIPLRTTLLFDHPTVRALAKYLVDEHGEAIAAKLRPATLAPAETAAPVGIVAPSEMVTPGEVVAPAGDGLAFVVRGPGSIDDGALEAFAPPALREGEVRIAVHASGINFGDLLCVKGLYPSMPPYPFVPGFEIAGTVTAIGPNVTSLSVGDEVLGVTGAALGGHASAAVTREEYVVAKPRALSFAEAASLPVAFLTVDAAFERACPRRGETVLIQSAAGGVGLTAIQLARAAGVRVIATAGSDEKCVRLRECGADAINYRTHDFKRAVLDLTNGRGVDIVLNALPGDAIQKGLDLLAPGGRYVEIAMTAMRAAGALDLSRLVDNQSFHSIDVRRMMLADPARAQAALQKLRARLDDGTLRAPVFRTMPVQSIGEALRLLDSRQAFGKIVLEYAREGAPVVVPEEEDDAIAIVGFSGRFPGAPDPATFWRNLTQRVCSVTEVPPGRWVVPPVYASEVRANRQLRLGAFLDDADRFDPLFFSLSGAEAELMDPQQRLFLEECWKAFEDAGIAPAELDGSRCGVFLGTGSGDYDDALLAAGSATEAHTFLGNEASVGAARIAYLLNLKGPTMAIGTACSSSLVALHLACRSIAAGECELALAGGVFVTATPRFHVLCSRAGMLAEDGRCKTFDDAADGFVPGEGVGVVVAMRLRDALREGFTVRAIVRGSSLNQDGRTNGITAPSVASQTELERGVYESAHIDPATIGYVECHGTGTVLGDPIEIEALTNAFGAGVARQSCAIGSVKTNIGHTVTAAGIAGVIKVLLALEHRQLPPTANFAAANRHIDFAATPFYVNTETRRWERTRGPRRAAISSFGFSGTNAHVVLEEAPERERLRDSGEELLFCFSAPTEDALQEQFANFIAWIERDGPRWRAADVAYTLAHGRKRFAVQCAVRAHDLDGVASALRQRRFVPFAEPRFEGKHQRVPLPVTRFHGGRYWPTVVAALHPLVHRRIADGVFETHVTRELALVRDHEVAGERVLPGAAYLEMARFAGSAKRIAGAAWLHPLVVGEEGATVTIHVARDGVEIRHGERTLATVSLTADESSLAAIDVAAIRRRCGTFIASDSMQERLARHGLRYGPSLRALGDVWHSDRELLARLHGGDDALPLDPAVIDGAWQALAAWFDDDAQLRPFSLAALEWTAPLAEARLAYVVREGDAFNVTLAREDGEAVAVLRRFVVRQAYAAPRAETIAFVPEWEPAALPSREEGEESRATLIVDDPDDPAAFLASLDDAVTRIVLWRTKPVCDGWPALLRTLQLERPGLVVQTVDGGTRADVLRELALGVPPAEVRYEGGVRLVRRMREVQLAPASRRRDGVWVVSGGAGGVGRIVVEHLLATGARVAVLGRAADVADRDKLRAALERIREHEGPIRGVFHLAGVLRDGLLGPHTDFDSVLAPKVRGAIHLDELTAAYDLEEFVLFSSIAGVRGHVGQGAYAMANRFLDELAVRRTGRGTTLSIAWPLLADGGMRITEQTRAAMRELAGLEPMPAAELVHVLEASLASGHRCVAVFHGDAGQARAFVSEPIEDDSVRETEQYCKRVIAGVLRIPAEHISAAASFEQYGLDSMLAVRLIAAFEQDLGPLPKTLLFEHRSVAALARALAGKRKPGPGPVPVPVRRAEAPPAPDAVAIIGIAGRYPESPDLDTFWRQLARGRDCIREIPETRWTADPRAKWGGFLDDVDCFDPLFFNISPREAERMDPQERLFLETAWSAVEDAGYNRASLSRAFGGEVGVFAGVMWSEYQLFSADPAKAAAMLGSSYASIANRVSYVLDLTGPSLAVDTMCSSSLTALHLACASLAQGECRAAIAGGVNLSLHPSKYRYLAQEGFLSADGRCRSFGEGGSGYVPGEGVGAVMLKPLARALADGDVIHGVIRATAVNHGGRTHSYTVPNPQAQAAVIRRVLERGGVPPETIGYIEAHGTGTSLGDPIEMRALALSFGARNGWRCPVGSVKSNIGHLEAAAGMAALTKVLLQMRHGQLVPSLHAEELNREIDFDATPFRVQRELAPWVANGSPRRAGISSFGAGGSNAHMLVEEPPMRLETVAEGPQLVVLSARDGERLGASVRRLLERLEAGVSASLAGIAYTLQTGREPLDVRLAVVAESVEELVQKLRAGGGEGVWSGSVAAARAQAGAVMEDEQGRAFIEQLLAAGDLPRLARLWVSLPIPIEWERLHRGTPRRVSLPGYPFARERYWGARTVELVPRPLSLVPPRSVREVAQ